MMILSLVGAVIVVPVIILIMVGIVFLQIRLSKKEHWFPGLIIPIVNVVLMLIVVLGMVLYNVNVATSDPNTFVVATKQSNVQAIMHMITISIYLNIPNGILLIIYFYQRSQLKKQRLQLEEE